MLKRQNLLLEKNMESEMGEDQEAVIEEWHTSLMRQKLKLEKNMEEVKEKPAIKRSNLLLVKNIEDEVLDEEPNEENSKDSQIIASENCPQTLQRQNDKIFKSQKNKAKTNTG